MNVRRKPPARNLHSPDLFGWAASLGNPANTPRTLRRFAKKHHLSLSRARLIAGLMGLCGREAQK